MLKDITKQELIQELENRVADKILEPTNFELLKKLIEKADTLDEAIMISELGTTYKRTGFHFDKRLENLSDTIKYFKKNEKLSFTTDESKPNHKLIIGDNYPSLLNLLIEYKRAIDVIYIDPPYGKDSMGEFAETNYENAITRDNLLSMLYPRLILAKMLLSENGLIFCSIDDRNHAYVKGLFDEVFTENCFVNSFVWQKNSSNKTEKDKFTVNHEYVLMYSRNSARQLHDTYKELAETSKKAYNKDDHDGRGLYATVSLQKPKNPGPETSYDYVDNSGKVWPCPPKGWRMVEKKIRALENDNRLYMEGETLRVKDYWNERKSTGKRIDTLWNDLPENSAASNELLSILSESSFENPKPTALVKRCIDIGNKIAIVLDFFAGSGTTGQAVLELNKEDGGKREFILVQNNEKTDENPNGIAFDVTTKRLKRVMSGCCYDSNSTFDWIKNNTALGDNLDVYEIAEVANFEAAEGKTPFEVIDETLYGVEKFTTMQEKVEWVCNNFEATQKQLEE